MKKIAIMLLATLMLFAFVACDDTQDGVKTATVGEWKDASTIAAQRTPMDFKKADDGSITLQNKAGNDPTKYGGVQANVTMDENSASWTVETTVTLPTTGTEGMNIGLWTDSDYSTNDQIRTDGILAAVYEKATQQAETATWMWKFYDENGKDGKGEWKTFANAEAPKAGADNTLKIEYSNGKFTFSANSKVLGTLDSDTGIDNDRLQTVFFIVKNLGATDSVKFTAPSVTYLTK